jgi:hypothetical protein
VTIDVKWVILERHASTQRILWKNSEDVNETVIKVETVIVNDPKEKE